MSKLILAANRVIVPTPQGEVRTVSATGTPALKAEPVTSTNTPSAKTPVANSSETHIAAAPKTGSGENCKPKYSQIYQPPLKLGGSGRIIHVNTGVRCG